jgi:hypothetical protein
MVAGTFKKTTMVTKVSNVICYSLRQLFANAAIAASHVAVRILRLIVACTD